MPPAPSVPRAILVQMWKGGMSIKAIARKFGLANSTVARHVHDPAPRTPGRKRVSWSCCLRCRRLVDRQVGDTLLVEPDHCAPCGRSQSESAKRLEELVCRNGIQHALEGVRE